MILKTLVLRNDQASNSCCTHRFDPRYCTSSSLFKYVVKRINFQQMAGKITCCSQQMNQRNVFNSALTINENDTHPTIIKIASKPVFKHTLIMKFNLLRRLLPPNSSVVYLYIG
mmetsp:Transcript_40374/g.47239  ORF Transcript_40374/g.47239 Transcript_40374/m.47239 type:complete len:114 (-) Transcript_40374:870-1211(-)